MYGCVAIEKLANRFMKSGNTEAAMKLYARLDGERIDSRVKLYESAYMDPARVARVEPYVFTLFNVNLETDHCAIFDGDKVYWRESSGRNFANHPYVHRRASRDLRFFAVSCPQPAAFIEEPFILLGTDGGANYSHWLSRNVLKLALLEMAGVPASLPILINEGVSNFQLEFIDLLGIPRSRLMPIKPRIVVRCREMFVPTTLRLIRRCAPELTGFESDLRILLSRRRRRTIRCSYRDAIPRIACC